jgi:branched-chain amino acid transport system substrate-binding protein
MRKLKIGFLMPYSGIYPYYGHHLMAGIQLAMSAFLNNDKTGDRRSDLQFVPVFTKNGDIKTLNNAVEQLLFFENVDLLSGLVSYRTLPQIVPIINRYQRPAILFDSGEYVPAMDIASPYVFLASQQIWQSEYALGRFAQEKFKNTGLVVLPYYEAGYHLHSCFWEGIQSVGGDSLILHTIGKEKSGGDVLDLSGFFNAVALDKPAFVHGIFTGNQGTDFIRQWISSMYYQKIPLILVENMAYDDFLDELSSLDFSFYAASSWTRAGRDRQNHAFVSSFESVNQQKANVFALLGYEVGLFIREIEQAIVQGDTQKVLRILRTQSIEGPRGSRNFDLQRIQSMPQIDIQHIQMRLKNVHTLTIDQYENCQFPLERMKILHEQSVSGWQNPYFCV